MRSAGSIASAPVKFRLPRFTPNTPSFVDEGTSSDLSNWTVETNATTSNPSSSVSRLTQTTGGGTQAKMRRTVSMPTSNKDWCFYLRVRGRQTTGDIHRVTLQSNTGTGTPAAPRLSIYFGFDSANNTAAAGMISLRYTNSSDVNTHATVVASGATFATDWYDIVLAYDSKYGRVNCEFRSATGGWVYRVRILCVYFGAQLDIVTNNASAGSPGSWVEYDWLELVKPNIIAIGDSSTAGNTLFSPNPAESLTDGTSRIWHDCPIYTDLRNNYIINRGVASDTSALVAARIQADALDNGPKLVILGACNNDNASISHADRTTNIQTSVTAINNAGAKCLLLNASYRTPTTGSQPTYRDYYRTWWLQYRGTVSGIHAYANRMTVLRDANEYHDPSYAQADGGHSNVAGYRRTKQQLAGITVT